jgi:hypothetical protein
VSARRGCAAASLTAVLLLTGCASAPVSRAPEGDPIDAARALPDAGGIVSIGDATGTCGEYVLEQGEELPPEAGACLVDASARGEAAELAWSTPTSEGDPIVSFAFVGGTATRLLVYTTHAFDRHSGLEEPLSPGESWTGHACDDPADLLGTGDCDPLVEG